ncbi:TetR/AcrR family transcriptional regulator [Sediminispirochaeta bajacaliforniensis]|uniref:TetR/AcrR family transcriptional regulator n=1 Tax=Sediminispirochaeta bajacaliforniensis TaxID=148 RepID=UPI00037CFF2B|nr:TetR/AcrR family transcriptional regulator [Sediminispirochaeta bajacaliforniensis]
MTDKQKRRKEEIIETAFRVWSESLFKKTSLSAVAARMGISKTALYRYFSGKEALLLAMEEFFLRLYNRLCDEVVRHRGERSVAEALEAYNRIFVGFFARNPHYLRFAQIRFIRKPEVGDSFLAMTFRRNMDLFPAEPLAREFGWRMAQIPVIVRYMLSVSNFLLTAEYFGNGEDG